MESDPPVGGVVLTKIAPEDEYGKKSNDAAKRKLTGKLKLSRPKFGAFVGLPFSNDANSGGYFPS